MKTIEICIPAKIHERGIKIATDAGITISEMYSLAVLGLLKYSDAELADLAAPRRVDNSDE